MGPRQGDREQRNGRPTVGPRCKGESHRAILTDCRRGTRSVRGPETTGCPRFTRYPEVSRPVWMNHWRLAYDPFHGNRGPYVPLPTHEEAVARLVHAIETGLRVVT